jgi:hypothetical protein
MPSRGTGGCRSSCRSRPRSPGPYHQWPLRIIGDAGTIQTRVQMRLEPCDGRASRGAGGLFRAAVLTAGGSGRRCPRPRRERRADPRERNTNNSISAVPQPRGLGDVDAVEQLPRFRCVEYRPFSPFQRYDWAAHGRGRVVRHDLAGEQPVGQVTDRREPLLDSRRGVGLRLQLDPRGHMQQLHGRDRRHSGAGAPGEKLGGHARIRATRGQVADRRCEERQEAHAGAFAGGRDERRRRKGRESDQRVHGEGRRRPHARASTTSSRWLASTIISTPSHGVSIGALRCKCGFLYEPMPPQSVLPGPPVRVRLWYGQPEVQHSA